MSINEAKPIYAGHGLFIESTIELGLSAVSPSMSVVPDMHLHWGVERRIPASRPSGDLLAELSSEHGDLIFCVARTTESVIVRYPGLCEFVGDKSFMCVQAHVDPQGAGESLLPILGSGAVIAIALAIRGIFALHASSVEVEGEAIAFVGRSGMGKSTMAAIMSAAGHPLVSDDVLRPQIEENSVVVYSGGIEGRLRDKAREIASTVPGASWAETADGRLALRPPLTAATTLPLRCCIVPIPSRVDHEIKMCRLDQGMALRRLLEFPRILGLCDRQLLSAQFNTAADIVTRVPVFEATIPWGPPFPSSMSDKLLDALI